MFIVIGKKPFTETLARLWEDAMARVQDELKGIKSVTDLAAKVKELRASLETLQIEKARKEEEYARKEREIEHKVGLERQRQEQELANAKREAIVSVREENLKADRDRFEAQMKFQEERFSTEVGYLKDVISDLAQRLPTANLTGTIGARKR